MMINRHVACLASGAHHEVIKMIVVDVELVKCIVSSKSILGIRLVLYTVDSKHRYPYRNIDHSNCADSISIRI